jgi:hypothetical protein
MSALPPKADMAQHYRDVRFVAISGLMQCSKNALRAYGALRARFYDFGVTRVACVALLIRIALSE